MQPPSRLTAGHAADDGGDGGQGDPGRGNRQGPRTRCVAAEPGWIVVGAPQTVGQITDP